jgi:putative endonuclease
MSNKVSSVVYTGVTSDLPQRAYVHKNHLLPGFTNKYNAEKLVWYEIHGSMEAAIKREKRIKKWNREWKEKLINEMNPDWRDLREEL